VCKGKKRHGANQQKKKKKGGRGPSPQVGARADDQQEESRRHEEFTNFLRKQSQEKQKEREQHVPFGSQAFTNGRLPLPRMRPAGDSAANREKIRREVKFLKKNVKQARLSLTMDDTNAHG